jgi:succinate dehydrogenase flavin-adding protein (antitoxin of CptAB toxin-antitoxin module)
VLLQDIKRLVYRSKQRGILELDLLFGEYAEKHVPNMNASQLAKLEEILTEENPDMWKWLTMQQMAPDHLQFNNSVFQARSWIMPMSDLVLYLSITRRAQRCKLAMMPAFHWHVLFSALNVPCACRTCRSTWRRICLAVPAPKRGARRALLGFVAGMTIRTLPWRHQIGKKAGQRSKSRLRQCPLAAS